MRRQLLTALALISLLATSSLPGTVQNASGMTAWDNQCATPDYSCAGNGYNQTTMTRFWGWGHYGNVSSNYIGSPYPHNCTLYAAFMLWKNGLAVDPGNWGDASNWGVALASVKNSTPVVGAIAWWSFGHVGYVQAINKSNNTVYVTSDNYGVTNPDAGNTSNGWVAATGSPNSPTAYLHVMDLSPGGGSVLTPVNGEFVRDSGTGEIAEDIGGALVGVPDAADCTALNCGSNQVQVADSTFQTYTAAHPTIADGTFVWDQSGASEAIGGTLVGISSPADCTALNCGSGSFVQTFNDMVAGYIAAHPTIANGTILEGLPSANYWTFELGGLLPAAVTSAAVHVVDSSLSTFPFDSVPAFTSNASTSFIVGEAGKFKVIVSAVPTATFSESGALPSGVTLSNTGSLSGTPAAGTGGTYRFTLTASNGIGTTAPQSFTLTVDQSPAITSKNSVVCTHSVDCNFVVTADGFPTPTLSRSGTLPSGMKFTVKLSQGKATITGTPSSRDVGRTFVLKITANNVVGRAVSQEFKLKVR
jgi:surface antigen